MYENSIQAKSVSADRSTTEIENALDRTNDAMSRLQERLSALENRLRPVMRVVGTGVAGSTGGVPQEALSPLGDAIRSIEGRADGASERIEVLLLGLAL